MDKTFFIIVAIVIAIINVVKILVPLFGQMGTTTGATGSKDWWQTAGFDYANKQLFDQQNQQLLDQQNQQMIAQQNQWFMEESLKSVTPWEMGGYDLNQGNSFNNFGGGCGLF